MNIEEKTKAILNKYDLMDITIDPSGGDWLQKKWESHIGEEWYGFELSSCPQSWILAIDEILEYIKEIEPQFIIEQIKIKYGGLRMYIGLDKEQENDHNTWTTIQKIANCAEDRLYDKRLVY